MSIAPYDPFAEITVVGCCVFDARASEIAHERLDAQDFFDGALAALFLITPSLPTVAPDHLTDPMAPLLWELRATRASDLTRVRLDHVREVVSRRASLLDESGRYARRVRSAARRRRIRAALVEAIQLVDEGDHARAGEIVTNVVVELHAEIHEATR